MFRPLLISPSDPPQKLYMTNVPLPSYITQLETYIKVEAWFLATPRAKSNPSTPTLPLISKSRAMHPTTCLGLLPAKLGISHYPQRHLRLHPVHTLNLQPFSPDKLSFCKPQGFGLQVLSSHKLSGNHSQFP